MTRQMRQVLHQHFAHTICAAGTSLEGGRCYTSTLLTRYASVRKLAVRSENRLNKCVACDEVAQTMHASPVYHYEW